MNSNIRNCASESVPIEITKTAYRSNLYLLQTKSRKQYNIAYNRLIKWCMLKNVV